MGLLVESYLPMLESALLPLRYSSVTGVFFYKIISDDDDNSK